MEITKVKVRLIVDKPRLKGIASITFDRELTINDIKVIQTGNRLCAEFPKHQFAKNNHLDLCLSSTLYIQVGAILR